MVKSFSKNKNDIQNYNLRYSFVVFLFVAWRNLALTMKPWVYESDGEIFFKVLNIFFPVEDVQKLKYKYKNFI